MDYTLWRIIFEHDPEQKIRISGEKNSTRTKKSHRRNVPGEVLLPSMLLSATNWWEVGRGWWGCYGSSGGGSCCSGDKWSAGVKWCHSSDRSLRSGAGGGVFICHKLQDEIWDSAHAVPQTQASVHIAHTHTHTTSVGFKVRQRQLCLNWKSIMTLSTSPEFKVKRKSASLHILFLLLQRKRVDSLPYFIYRFCYFQTFDQCGI